MNTASATVTVFAADADFVRGYLLPGFDGLIHIDAGSSLPDCGPPADFVPGGVALVDPRELDADTFLATLGPSFRRAASEPPPTVAFDLAGVKDDCDLLQQMEAVDAFLTAVFLEIEALVDDLEFCAAVADALYCDAVRKIDATVPPEISSVSNPEAAGLGSSGERLGRASPRFRGPCVEAARALFRLIELLDDLRFEAARCDDATQAIQDIIDRTGTVLPEAWREPRKFAAASHRRKALEAHAHGQAIEAQAVDLKSSFLSVGDSCEACETEDRLPLHDVPVLVGVDQASDPLAVVREALKRALAASRDDEIRAGLGEMLARIDSVSADRVLHVSYPTTGALETVRVAIADPFVLKPKDEPLVVVLHARPLTQDDAPASVADLTTLHAAYRTFVALLDPEDR